MIVPLIALSFVVIYISTGVSIFHLVSNFTAWVTDFFKVSAGRKYVLQKKMFAEMSITQKRKSQRYKLYFFLNEIILSMGWRNKGITVEGVQSTFLLLTCICYVTLSYLFKGLLLSLLVSALAYIMMYAVLFLLSRINHAQRKQALLDAEDMLCGSMEDGLVMAVSTCVGSIDPLVSPIFYQFLDEIYNRNTAIGTAIENLNLRCGEQFDLFCEKAKTYEKERRIGSEKNFQYNITHNASVRKLDRSCAKVFADLNENFIISIGIIFIFMVLSLSINGTAQFYTTGFGRLLLAIYAVLCSISFIYSQYIQSKPFKYASGVLKKEKDYTSTSFFNACLMVTNMTKPFLQAYKYYRTQAKERRAKND